MLSALHSTLYLSETLQVAVSLLGLMKLLFAKESLAIDSIVERFVQI